MVHYDRLQLLVSKSQLLSVIFFVCNGRRTYLRDVSFSQSVVKIPDSVDRAASDVFDTVEWSAQLDSTFKDLQKKHNIRYGGHASTPAVLDRVLLFLFLLACMPEHDSKHHFFFFFFFFFCLFCSVPP